ncbi:hypothetical protein J6590_084806 [Homalodisca vitripennis]|nr:hypothetical protein J6590_084806 [Homalodisca vitripennis]
MKRLRWNFYIPTQTHAFNEHDPDRYLTVQEKSVGLHIADMSGDDEMYFQQDQEPPHCHHDAAHPGTCGTLNILRIPQISSQ